MLRLGTGVKVGGCDAVIIARTLCGAPRYDVRLRDGSVLSYVPEADIEVLPPEPAAQMNARR
ncbi:MAG TPA: hypothetical protein VD978_12765 [Azospirillum sp.]|nr:hypothetical protein [Azospirillum sp.]